MIGVQVSSTGDPVSAMLETMMTTTLPVTLAFKLVEL
jgi:hypothetical protein